MRLKSFTKFFMQLLLFTIKALFMVISNLKIFSLIKKLIIFLSSLISALLKDTKEAQGR